MRCSSLALDGQVEGWRVDLARLADAAELTAAVTRENYPDLRIPFHARARHFVAGAPRLPEGDPAERARAAFDLVILSVLLDAGTGPGWRFADPVSGGTFTRSEGLAVASQRMVEAGELRRSCRPRRGPPRPAASRSPTTIRWPASTAAPPCSAASARRCWPGRTCSRAGARAASTTSSPPALRTARLPAPAILELLLEALGPIWADRLTIDGIPLGDCWRHPAIRRDDAPTASCRCTSSRNGCPIR